MMVRRWDAEVFKLIMNVYQTHQPDDELWTIEQFLEKNEEACR